ncbi:hypothetical protein HMPREF3023_02805 [Peptoniphilus sp. HMSC075B08]|uniref:tripartite tricarboxylate transporter TctB family protein n=1 Tax=Peptoniphilus sp. HMSC075B08 TaxID=1739525 RepID=UPI0008A60ECE|nr:tripartite tricarboxylate transporter TctB family protein [Peptoniphilus sp. HMSC075B08]OFO61137.1 hypothetical protein HMPREF3023_02805 [Peptoniphilus sp. HMSC075B08]
MTKKVKEILISVVFMLVGIFIYIQAMNIEPLMKNELGSGYFPKVVAGTMIVLSILNLFLNLKKTHIEDENNTKSDLFGGLSTIALIGIYSLLYQKVGFLIGTSLYLFLQILILAPKEKRNIMLFAIISVVFSVFVYYLFTRIINMPLPKGIFGF